MNGNENAYRIVVPGEPVGKGRPRFTMSGHAFTPQKTRDAEARVRKIWKDAGHPCFEGAVSLHMVCYYGIPKSDSKKKRAEKLEQKVPVTKLPDEDNVLKLIADSLNGGVAFRDDRQICEVWVQRYWSDEPRVVFEVAEFSPQECWGIVTDYWSGGY